MAAPLVPDLHSFLNTMLSLSPNSRCVNIPPPSSSRLTSRCKSLRNPLPVVRITSKKSFSKQERQWLLPNAQRMKRNSKNTNDTSSLMGFNCGFSLGIDLGDSRTGIAISNGFVPRPLTVLELRGDKLESRLMCIADEEEVDEFLIGLPKSSDGKETPQSNKVRSIAGRFAVRAAERGWRVYLQDEHGTSADAMDFMIDM